MRGPFIRRSGLLVLACLALGPASAEVTMPAPGMATAGFSLAQDAALAAEVRTRLQQGLPGEAIEVRTANAGLVLSGQVTTPDRLKQALAIAQASVPGRVSNLMTLGQTPAVTLTVTLAEMPPAVARNLSASLAMTGFFSSSAAGIDRPGLVTGRMDVPDLIAALDAKGALRLRASPTLTFRPGQGAQPVAGRGCGGQDLDGGARGEGLDLTATRTADGRIAVAIRACGAIRSGVASAVDADPQPDATVTVLLQDGQTITVDNLLPTAQDARGAVQTVLLITAQIGAADRAPAAVPDGALGRIATDAGILLISEAARVSPLP